MKAFKKITASLLLLAGMMPLLLPLAMDVKEKIIEHRMKEELKSNRGLQTVVIPEKDVVWMDKHEIWVNNQMFDISEKKLENGIYTFTGLYDEEETELVMQEKESSERNSHEGQELSRVFDTLLHLYCSTLNESILKPTLIISYSFLIAGKLPFPFTSNLTPPPQGGQLVYHS